LRHELLAPFFISFIFDASSLFDGFPPPAAIIDIFADADLFSFRCRLMPFFLLSFDAISSSLFIDAIA